MCVKVIASQRWDVFETRCIWWTSIHKRLWLIGQQISTGFASWLRYCTDVAWWRSTKLVWPSPGLVQYTIYIFGGLVPRGILRGAIFTLCPSLAFSSIGSVTARHSSSGRQPNFTVWDMEGNYGTFVPRLCHLCLAGWPLHWALAHILVYINFSIVIATSNMLVLHYH